VIRELHVGPLFSAKLVRWSEHPVLSKPPVIRGIISADGSPGRVDMSLGDQLRQRAAIGGGGNVPSWPRSRPCYPIRKRETPQALCSEPTPGFEKRLATTRDQTAL